MAAVEKNLMEVVMNPTRQRIMQYMVIYGQGSTGEMRREMPDIPPASLYRHVKLLLDAHLLEVVKEERIRGVVSNGHTGSRRRTARSGQMMSGRSFRRGFCR